MVGINSTGMFDFCQNNKYNSIQMPTKKTGDKSSPENRGIFLNL